MKIVDVLMSFKHFSFMEQILTCSKVDAKNYIKITERHINSKICYHIQAQQPLNELTGSVLSSIIIDTKFHLLKAECGCLQFYRKKECVHTVSLLMLAIKVLDDTVYDRIMKSYNHNLIRLEQAKILNNLALELKTSSNYFKKINLIAQIILQTN